MIYIVGISIAFFLCLLILSKKGKTQADKILTGWLLLMGIHLSFFYFYISGISYRYPFTLALNTPFPLLHGPFLFLYTASLTNQLPARKRLLFLHFVPAVICWLCLISFYILPAEQKIYIFQNKGKGFETFMLINLTAIIISGISYVVWSLILLSRHRKAILNQFSYTEKINLRWLQFLIYGIAFIWILVFTNEELLFTGVVFFVVLIGYFGIKQPGIFITRQVNGQLTQSPGGEKASSVQPANYSSEHSAEDRSIREVFDPGTPDPAQTAQSKVAVVQDDPSEKRKYSKSGLTAEMADNLHSRLTRLMETEKIYTESELSLSELANRLHTLPNYLSQVINDKEGKNFYDYINMLRIEEFKNLIARPESKKYTLLSLSFDCGFNSKSSFNKNFKKVTGQSPSEYLNQLAVETVA